LSNTDQKSPPSAFYVLEVGFSYSFILEFNEILSKKNLASAFRKPGFLNPPSSPNCPTNLKIVNLKLEGGISIVKKNCVVQKNLFTNKENWGILKRHIVKTIKGTNFHGFY
jgi:hypothetical protein